MPGLASVPHSRAVSVSPQAAVSSPLPLDKVGATKLAHVQMAKPLKGKQVEEFATVKQIQAHQQAL